MFFLSPFSFLLTEVSDHSVAEGTKMGMQLRRWSRDSSLEIRGSDASLWISLVKIIPTSKQRKSSCLFGAVITNR